MSCVFMTPLYDIKETPCVCVCAYVCLIYIWVAMPTWSCDFFMIDILHGSMINYVISYSK